MTLTKGYALGADEGEAFWFLGTLMTVKAGSEHTGGGFTLVEALAPPGFAPPLHVHHGEDEGFYILEGEMHVTCGDESWTARPGGFVLLPREVPHTFIVTGSQPLKVLQVTSPAQFERFAADIGEPAGQRVLPPPAEVDIPRLIAAGSKYGYELLGPPPGAH